jgi:putative aldouronate transport system permease protein
MMSDNVVHLLPREARATSLQKRLRRHWQLYLILLAPFICLVIFSYAPMFGVVLAFKEFDSSLGVLRSPWVGFKHFVFFFSTASSRTIIGNSLFLAFYWIMAMVPPPVILAIALNEARSKRLRKSVQMITYAPYFISTVVMVSIIMQVLDVRTGIVNKLIAFIGGRPSNLMANGALFPHVYVLSGIWQSAGFNAVIYLAALVSIDPGLYEAALIDGASKVQRIRYIDLPSLVPTIAVLLLLNMGTIMTTGTNFEKIFLMQNPANIDSSEVITTYVYKVGLLSMNFGFSTAVNLFNSVVNLLLVFLTNATVKRLGAPGLW